MGRFCSLLLASSNDTVPGAELGPMLRSYKEAEHSSGFSKSNSKAVPSRPGLSQEVVSFPCLETEKQ